MEELEIQKGGQYLVYGTDYSDRKWDLKRIIAISTDLRTGEIDLREIRKIGDMVYYQPKDLELPPYYREGFPLGYLPDGVEVCSLSVGKVPNQNMDAETKEKYRVASIALLEGTVEEFLQKEEGNLWKSSLETGEINNHAFPILTVDNLSAVAQFAVEDAYLSEGRNFSVQERNEGKKVCILSESLTELNGLVVGDKISLQYYQEDHDLQSLFILNQSNPTACYYSPVLGFDGEAQEYEIVGLYRQKDEWQESTYAFTPNTIFVPKKSVTAETQSTIRDIGRLWTV